MLKLSFDKKKLGKEPIETQVFNNTVTKVTITGILIDGIGIDIPEDVGDFIKDYTGIAFSDLGDDFALIATGITITATGISKRNKEDAYDKVLGYRIAESKAKIKLYKFMLNVCKKYSDTLEKCLFGYIDRFYTLRSNLPDGIIGDINKYSKLLKTEEQHLKTLCHDN